MHHVEISGTCGARTELMREGVAIKEVAMRTMSAVIALAVALGIATGAYAQETRLKGEITKADESTGTITLKHDQAGTVGAGLGAASEDYKVKDGLLFNAVKAGDKVQVTVERIDGKMTITGLQKE
jgi:Cu/Ag efflux protein CusF